MIVASAILGAVSIVFFLAELWCRRLARTRGYYVYLPRERWRVVPIPGLSSQVPQQSLILCNSLGERGREARQTDSYKVLLIGGSAGECLMLSNGESLAGQLEAKLTLAGWRAHVTSICRSGLNSMGVSRALECILQNHKSVDLVVAFIGASDVLNWVHLDASPEALTQPPDDKIFRVRPRADFSWKMQNLALREWARNFLFSRMGRWTVLPRAGRRQVAAREKLRSLSQLSLQDVQDPEQLLSTIRASTCKIVDVARRRSKKVLIVPQIQISHRAFPDIEQTFWQGTVEEGPRKGKRFSHDAILDLMTAAQDVILTAARDSDAEVLDLRTVFEPQPRDFYDEFHLTCEGSDHLATVFFSTILNIR